MTDAAVPQAIAELEIDAEGYHRCQTCHTTIDIPLDLYLRLDSGVFQNGREVKLVDLNEPWEVRVYWSLVGGLSKAICVDWCLSVKYESMGDDREFEDNDVITTEPCDRYWHHSFPGRGITVRGDECADVYRIVVVLSARDKCRKKPVGITGFCDLNLVQFYTGLTDN